MLESVRKNLGERWTDDFGKSDASDTEKPIQEMSKEESKLYRKSKEEEGSHCNWLSQACKLSTRL